MSSDAHSFLTDKSYLTAVQYQTGANLAARQSIYAFQEPKIDLVAAVLGLATWPAPKRSRRSAAGTGSTWPD